MSPSHDFIYTGAKTRQISFPLGGIGTGCIGLAGNGRLVDWEIFNRPNKGSVNGFSHFAVRVETLQGQVRDARILNSDLQDGLNGSFPGQPYASFGFGAPREYLAGAPHFRAVEFTGEFPIARLDFLDATFPGLVSLTAFNPFIPLNEFDSGLPAAFFEFEVQNISKEALVYTFAGALNNPLPANNLHTLHTENELTWLHLASDGPAENDPGYGTLALGTDAPETSAQAYWFRGAWFDALEVYWKDFTAPGKLKARSYPVEQAGKGNCASLAAHLTLQPGATGKVRFLIAWHFPNFENYWNQEYCATCGSKGVSTIWKNYYATQFDGATEVLSYCLKRWDLLYAQTLAFKNALFASTLPPVALEAISANISILKTPTVARLEDGSFYGFEGCHPNSGCCEGTCTHVWNYAQALPFLFPSLERSIRETDFRYNQRRDGAMRFRFPIPPSSAEEYWPFRACADGQFGGVLKTYREWKVCGDTDWLKRLWPAVKKSIEYAWAESNEDLWDPDKRGVLHGRMHHTLDMELFGPDAWLTGFYLAALKAGAEMAEAVGEPEAGLEYRAIFTRGKAWADLHLFNGEYYTQVVDLKDRARVEKFGALNYWDAEHEEIKYQIGEGCEIDQVLAQWHANLYGLGEIFDPRQTFNALKAIYRHNFKKPVRGYFNPCRVFMLNDEAGLVMCAWPEGRPRPTIPVPYSQEVMTGMEYAAAGQMIQNGMVKEGLEIVAAIRNRYDGEKRNPWNEIECGSNYARAMASYALLNAFSGFEFDMPARKIGFHPLPVENERFRCFWSLDSAWGVFELTPDGNELRVLYGNLELEVLVVPLLGRPATASLGGVPVDCKVAGDEVYFTTPVLITAGQSLQVRF